jgi:endonuclease-8
MPEGDAVRRTAIRLDAALAGRELSLAQIRVPRFAAVDLRGAVVSGTDTRGKHLLTRMQLGGRSLTLHSHLRMDGRWITGAASPRPCAGPAHLIRVWLGTGQSQAVGLRLAQVAVLAPGEVARVVGHLGPDILAADFDPGDAAARVAAAGRGLVEVLLDQRIVSGLGTMWAAELAHRIGVSPFAPGVAAERLRPGLAQVRLEMLAAVTAAPLVSRARLRVFERAGQPCRTCGTAIRAGRVGAPARERVTYWCPQCQR